LTVRRVIAPNATAAVDVPTVGGTISTRRPNGNAWKTALAGSNPTSALGDWEFTLADDAPTRALFANSGIKDLLLVLTYRGDTPKWV
jgi:hypothetical protein